MVLGIQVIGVLFGLFLIYLTFLFHKRKEFTFNEWAFWTLISLMFMIVSLFPQILDGIVKSLNLYRTMDLFIILGFMFLIAAVFYSYKVTRATQRRLEEVVRIIALERQTSGKQNEKLTK